MYVEGRLQVREYEDKDGNARTSVEVVASKVRFLGRRKQPRRGEAAGSRPTKGQGGDSRRLRRTTSIRAGMILRSRVEKERPGLSEGPLSAAEGQTTGRDQRRIHRGKQNEESRVKWPYLTNSCGEPKNLLSAD